MDGAPVAVTGGNEGMVRVWDLASGTPIGQPINAHTDWVTAVACTTMDGAPVAVTGGDDGTVRVWDLASGTPIGQPMTGHTRLVTAVACTDLDGAPVAVTGGTDGTVRVWDARTHQPAGLVTASSPSAVAVTPDGYLVIGTGHDVAVFTRQGQAELT
jgi:WD40 repeat protein